MSESPTGERAVALVVDDDQTMRVLLRECLERAGLAVVEATDGVEALSAFPRVRPDIVFLDVMMARLDGFATCQALRLRPDAAHTPIVIVTGLDDTESIDHAYVVGATDFLTKPLNWTLLPHRVRYILRASRALREVARAREEAEAANRAKSEFLATMSHELRTPLSVILGYTQLLLETPSGEGDPAPDQADLLGRIDGNARELFELISAVLDVSRLASGHMPMNTEHVRLADLLREVEAETHDVRELSGLAFHRDVAPDLPAIETDRGKVKVVIKNLINNAVKFTPSGGITLRAHARDGGVQIDVVDTGVGISADAVPTIFEPFVQIAPGLPSSGARTPSRGSGAGLGLHIVKRLLDLVGGRIEVESVVGTGSKFHVWLPARSDEATRAS